MQVSLKYPSKTSIKKHPNYRVVQVSRRQGSVGMLLPQANLVVPNKRTIRDLRDLIQLYKKLEAQPFFKDKADSVE